MLLGFFLYSIINIDLIMPYYFASFEEMIIHSPINKIRNQKEQLPISYLFVQTSYAQLL
jgi:hypothetical protein